MRKLDIDWGELRVAFESGLAEMEHYLDLETGQVLMVSQETRWYLEQPLDEALQGWQQEMRQTAQRIQEGYGTRYVSIPCQDSHASYGDMERFIPTVQDQALQDQLWAAIQGEKAFRRFEDALLAHPAEGARWSAFSDRCVHQRMLDWLTGQGIEPTQPAERPEMPEPTPDETLVEDLSLLLIYLTSWEEPVVGDLTVRRAWKGYLFEVLDVLQERGLIEQSRRAKSLTLTQEGLRRAQELREKYGRQ